MENFQEIAQRLLSGGGAIQVESGQELVEQAKRLLKDSEGYEQVGKAALAVVRANLGATQAIIKVLDQYLKG
jgi:3-deoxy-D-manno-octulosonic-acid transferase